MSATKLAQAIKTRWPLLPIVMFFIRWIDIHATTYYFYIVTYFPVLRVRCQSQKIKIIDIVLFVSDYLVGSCRHI